MTMRGKTVLITGANTGIGKATALELAKQGATVIFACRSKQKTTPVIDEIARESKNDKLEFLELDLADLAQVKRAAQEVLTKHPRLDVLIANAGLARVRTLTAQGFEMTFGVNHLGHMLLTLLLEPALTAAAPSRVVVVASRAHERTRSSIDFGRVRTPTSSRLGWPEYVKSKLANMLFMAALARKWQPKGIHAYGLHPGVIASDIWRSVPPPFRQLGMLFMRTTEEGARASVHCATSDAAGTETGQYYDEDGSKRAPNPLVADEAAQEALWKQSLEWLTPFLQ